MTADYETAVFALYRYPPSLPAAVVAIVLFLLTAGLHTYQVVRTRAWFILPLVIGGYFEWVGYIGRAINSQQTPNWALGAYIQQSVLLLVAPALFAATIYMTLGRIVRLCRAETHLLVRETWLIKIFVIGDIFSFLIQSSGAGIMAQGTLDAMNTGQNIVIGGLVLQILFFGLFVAVSSVWNVRMNRDTRKSIESSDIPWQKHIHALYAASTLILIRSVYRVVEYLQGNNGYIMRHEWWVYIFDGLLMLIVLFIFNIVHGSELSRLLKEKRRFGREEAMQRL